jgi:hypothetical protein
MAENKEAALVKQDQQAVTGKLVCGDCQAANEVTGYGARWKCWRCRKWNRMTAEEIYRRRRKVFLDRPEHPQGALLLEMMLDAVTLTVPDLDAVMAEPWPGSKPPERKRPIDRMLPGTVFVAGVAGLAYGILLATAVFWMAWAFVR